MNDPGEASPPESPEAWPAYARARVARLRLGESGYPAALAGDHEAPEFLFALGDLAAIDGRRVAIVGTRRCSHLGRDVARDLGYDLAAAGVRVVSGLAAGIDGAAHSGALAARAAPPVGVVGSGLDVVYPRGHTALWAGVARSGVLLSEAPIGAAPEPWRFPPRNRILAALAEVVIVVESHPKGGSRYTVDAAIARGVPVMAVPGSVRASASSLPNQLLSEGCAPVRDALDVLVALGLGRAGGSRTEGRPAPRPGDAAVLAALGWEPVSLETAVLRVGIDVAAVSVALARLEDAGWVRDLGGRWERCASPP